MQRTNAAGHIDHLFVEEDINANQPPTQLTAVWFNTIQEELANVVEAADLTLNANNNAQVLAAIQALIVSIGSEHFVASGAVSESAKWDSYAIGHMQPFDHVLLGSITTWLAAHPKWRKVNNSVFADIEGRALAVASSTHAAGSQFGDDDAVVVEHTHPYNDKGEWGGGSGTGPVVLEGGANNRNTGNASDGMSGIDKNIQRTQYFDWIQKFS